MQQRAGVPRLVLVFMSEFGDNWGPETVIGSCDLEIIQLMNTARKEGCTYLASVGSGTSC